MNSWFLIFFSAVLVAIASVLWEIKSKIAALHGEMDEIKKLLEEMNEKFQEVADNTYAIRPDKKSLLTEEDRKRLP
jgi:predicted nuclease with TOPRIM domain